MNNAPILFRIVTPTRNAYINLAMLVFFEAHTPNSTFLAMAGGDHYEIDLPYADFCAQLDKFLKAYWA